MADMTSRGDHSEIGMRDFYNILFRQKKKIVGVFASVMIVVSVATIFGSKVYKSQAELLVRIGRENATLSPTVATGKLINVSQDRENEINSEVDILRSRELAEKVVGAVGAGLILHGARQAPARNAPVWTALRYWAKKTLLFPCSVWSHLLASGGASGGAEEMENSIQAFKKRLVVEASKKSNMIALSYEANDPALAQKILSQVVSFYLEKHIEVNRTEGSYAFFKKEKHAVESSLDRTEEEIKNLKNRTAVASVTEQRRILMARIGTMKSTLQNTQSAIAASNARVEALEATLAHLPDSVRKDETRGVANSAADSLRKNIYELELQEQQLLTKFKQNTVPVRQIRRRVEEGRALLVKAQQQSQVTTGINENFQKLQLGLLSEKARLVSLAARAEALKSQLKSTGEELDSLNSTEIRFERLARELANQKASYRKYSESLEQSRIDQALDMQRISNISIVEPATYSIKPAGPKRLLNLALGFLLGLFGGLGLAFFSEFLDHSLQKPEDIEKRLQLPVVAALPSVCLEGGSEGRLLTLEDAIQVQTGRELLLDASGNSAALGDLLALCSHRPRASSAAIALVGCHSKEGTSSASALLATQLATRNEGRILLIDANTCNPSQHVRFGTKLSSEPIDSDAPGFSDLGSIQPAMIENLDILSIAGAGREISPGRLKLLSETLAGLRRNYGVIVCDLPPVFENASSKRIAAMMDGVYLVVEAEKTRWEVARHAKDALLHAEANVMGVVLNKRRFHIPEWLYRAL